MLLETLYLDLEDLKQIKSDGDFYIYIFFFFFFLTERTEKSYSFRKEPIGCITVPPPSLAPSPPPLPPTPPKLNSMFGPHYQAESSGAINVLFYVCSQHGDIRPPPPPPQQQQQQQNCKKGIYIIVSYTKLHTGLSTISLTIEIDNLSIMQHNSYKIVVTGVKVIPTFLK